MAFNFEKFTETSVAVQFDDLDFTTFKRQPLDASMLRVIRYMCDVEYHTSCYLRDLLVSPSRKKPEAAGFMTMWNREEFWHGEALAAVLHEHGIIVDYDEVKAKRVKLGWQDALGPLKQSWPTSLIGDDFVAVHMSWGATNELSAVAAYRRMAEMTDHPTLSPLLMRIAQQETRHVAFYTTQAIKKMEESDRAKQLVKLTLTKAWKPVGTSIMGDDEVRAVMGTLFEGQRKIIENLDHRVAKFPGLEGVTVFQDAFERLGVNLD